MDEKAATSQRAEQQFLTGRPEAERKPEQTIAYHAPSASIGQPTILLADTSKAFAPADDPHTKESSNLAEECIKCIESIQKKMAWARLSLERETDPNTVAAYLKVITDSAEAISTLRKFAC